MNTPVPSTTVAALNVAGQRNNAILQTSFARGNYRECAQHLKRSLDDLRRSQAGSEDDDNSNQQNKSLPPRKRRRCSSSADHNNNNSNNKSSSTVVLPPVPPQEQQPESGTATVVTPDPQASTTTVAAACPLLYAKPFTVPRTQEGVDEHLLAAILLFNLALSLHLDAVVVDRSSNNSSSHNGYQLSQALRIYRRAMACASMALRQPQSQPPQDLVVRQVCNLVSVTRHNLAHIYRGMGRTAAAQTEFQRLALALGVHDATAAASSLPLSSEIRSFLHRSLLGQQEEEEGSSSSSLLLWSLLWPQQHQNDSAAPAA